MTSAIFPVLPGLEFNNTRTPIWSTKIHTAINGREQRAALWSYPLYRYSVSFEFLRADDAYLELQALGGFFLAMRGSFYSWLYSDPSDNFIADQLIGAGDGVSVAFQMVRTYGAGFTFTEPMMAITGIPVIKVAGVIKTAGADYAINGAGLVTFAAAPTAGIPISASFGYCRRCRFMADELETAQFMDNLWEAKTVEFRTVK